MTTAELWEYDGVTWTRATTVGGPAKRTNSAVAYDPVNHKVLVEIKIAPHYDKRDEAQLLNMLKATGSRVGILLNFGRYKVEYRRLIF